MLPLVTAALGAWLLPDPWPLLAVQLAITWAAIILAFIGGVRRGYGFGQDRPSTGAAILDARAALGGNAPLHFAALRPLQLTLGATALAALWAWLLFGGQP